MKNSNFKKLDKIFTINLIITLISLVLLILSIYNINTNIFIFKFIIPITFISSIFLVALTIESFNNVKKYLK